MKIKLQDPFLGLTPFKGFMSSLDNDFNTLFNRSADRSYFQPLVDFKERDNRYELTAELPGVAKEDVKVEVTDGILTISGEKKSEKNETKDRYSYSEVQYGSFTRSWTLPENAQEEGIKADFKNGVLKLEIPKAKTQATKSKQIQIS